MAKYLTFLPAFMLSTLMAFAQEFSYSPGDSPLPYRLLVPERAKTDKGVRLVVFLHGSGERGSDNEKQIKHIKNLFLNDKNLKKHPCMVLAPQCPAEQRWSHYDKINDYVLPENMGPNLRHVFDIISGLQKTYKIEHVVIAGLSMGGNGAFEAAIRYPHYFKKAAIICGWTDAAKLNQRFDTEFRLYHGSEDETVVPQKSRDAYQVLKEAGNQAEYKEYPGVKHNSWENAFNEPDFLKWLLK